MDRQQMELFLLKTIFQLSNRLQAKGDQLSEKLTLKQWFLLAILYKGKIKKPTINELAVSMGITRQSTKKIITNLEKENYLTLEKSITDHRAVCVLPTKKAAEFFKENKDLAAGFTEEVFQQVDSEELKAAYLVLTQLKENLNKNFD